jgi:hypothetical protein
VLSFDGPLSPEENAMARIPLALLVALAVPALARAAEPAQMKEGLWEISASVDVPGMPFKLPAQKVEHCYTKEEAGQAESAVPQQQKDCKMTENKKVGNKVTWKVVCTGKNAGTGEGEIVFAGGNAYDGWMKFDQKGQVMTTKYSAKRLGDCKK